MSKDDREYGVAVKIVVNCAICGDIAPDEACQEQVGIRPTTLSKVNVLVVRAVISTGNRQTALNDIFSALNISSRGMHTKTYQDYVKNKMNPAALSTSAGVMSKCTAAVKSTSSELNFANPGNIAVSFDETWLTRGHLSHICVGTVVELFSGYELDVQVLTCAWDASSAPTMMAPDIVNGEFDISAKKKKKHSEQAWPNRGEGCQNALWLVIAETCTPIHNYVV